MHTRVYGACGAPVVPGQRAAFRGFEKQVSSEIEAQMYAEMEAANDKTGMEEWVEDLLKDELEQFASELETARLVYSRHPRLVAAKTFPEPYRSVIIAQQEHDPERMLFDYRGPTYHGPGRSEPQRNQKTMERLAASVKGPCRPTVQEK